MLFVSNNLIIVFILTFMSEMSIFYISMRYLYRQYEYEYEYEYE